VSQSSEPAQDQPVRSPLAGCLIFIVIAVVVIFVITFAAYSFKKQTEGFAAFAEMEELKTEITSVSDPAPLIQRLTKFESAVKESKETKLTLSKDDINQAIAHFPQLESLRGHLFLTEITPKHIHADFHLPLASTKDLPELLCKALGIEQRDHFLKSTIDATPLLTDGQLFLKLDKLTPSRGEVPDQVREGISPFQIFSTLADESRLKDTLGKLTSAEISDGQISLSYSPAGTPPSGKEEADKLAEKARHLVALGALIFILTMILFFIFLARKKKAAQ